MKKVISLILVAMMLVACFAMTACSNKSEAAKSFKLGGIGPLTGGAAIYGNAAMNGAKIAVDEINAKNGAITFEWNPQDDAHDAEQSVNAYNTLVDWGVQAIVGCVTSAPCAAVATVANEDRVFMMTPSASSPDVTEGKTQMFQICFTDPSQGALSAEYIATNLSDKKVAVIYKNDDAYSQGIYDTFVEGAAANNMEILYAGTFNDGTATDFSVQLTAAQAAGADLIFLPMYYTPASVIMKQASDMGYDCAFFGVDGMDGILAMEGFDTSLAEGVYLLVPFDATSAKESTKAFVAKYEELYGETPNQFAADGYDAVYAIYQALEKAGCKPSDKPADICEALRKATLEMNMDGITGTMSWNETGAVTKSPLAVVIENGVYVSAK